MSDTPKIQIFIHLQSVTNRALIIQAVHDLVDEGFGTLIDAEDLDAAFQLIVTDLGIETDNDTTFTNDDLQLLKDGIQAECANIEGAVPKVNCPCCGRKTL